MRISRKRRLTILLGFVGFTLTTWILGLRVDVSIEVELDRPQKLSHLFTKCPLSPESASAVERAKTVECKRAITTVGCLHSQQRLFPASVTNECPLNKKEDIGKLYGCYTLPKGTLGPILYADHFVFPKKNSKEKCIRYCTNAGFALAGLQNGDNCYCGHQPHPNATGAPNLYCEAFPCPGDSTTSCGGLDSQLIFYTGINKPQHVGLRHLDPVAAGTRDNLPSVRILFLFIISGRAVRQVKRLINAVYSPQHYYYIHVDKRNEYLYRQLLDLEKSADNIRLAHNRISVLWAGISPAKVVPYCLRNIFEAQSDWQWDFVINLTESDFLLHNVEDLAFLLAHHPNRTFLSPAINVHNYACHTGRGFCETFLECEGRMWHLGPRKTPENFVFDGQSEHFVLSRSFAHYISFSKDKIVADINLIFDHTIIAAETYLASMAINSKFCGSVIYQNFRFVNWKPNQCVCLRGNIVDWCVCSPYVFRIADAAKLRDLSYFHPLYIARKFESTADLNIVDHVERQLISKYIRLSTALKLPKLADIYMMGKAAPGFNCYWENYYSQQHDVNMDKYKVDLMMGLAVLSVSDMAEELDFSSIEITNLHLFKQADRQIELLVMFNLNEKKTSKRVLLETLVQLKNTRYIPAIEDGFQQIRSRFKTLDVNSDLDPKELFFRNYLGTIAMSNKLDILYEVESGPDISVDFRIYRKEQLVFERNVFIRETFVQHLPVEPNHVDKEADSLEIWHLKVNLSKVLLADISFLVAPSKGGRFETDSNREKLRKFYQINDLCRVTSDVRDENVPPVAKLPMCINTVWSSTAPDVKAQFKPIRAY